MKKELDEKLVKDFPLLYKDRHVDCMVTCMCWGFETGDGRESLIRELSEKLEALIKAMPEDKQSTYRASQVKEKFGYLHFYMTSYTNEIRELIKEAAEKSEVTCEVCGKEGYTVHVKNINEISMGLRFKFRWWFFKSGLRFKLMNFLYLDHLTGLFKKSNINLCLN